MKPRRPPKPVYRKAKLRPTWWLARILERERIRRAAEIEYWAERGYPGSYRGGMWCPEGRDA